MQILIMINLCKSLNSTVFWFHNIPTTRFNTSKGKINIEFQIKINQRFQVWTALKWNEAKSKFSRVSKEIPGIKPIGNRSKSKPFHELLVPHIEESCSIRVRIIDPAKQTRCTRNRALYIYRCSWENRLAW